MIEKEYGKYIGVCDICGEVTPIFDTWTECREYIRDNWKTSKNKQTGEWENTCSECNRKIARLKTLQDFN